MPTFTFPSISTSTSTSASAATSRSQPSSTSPKTPPPPTDRSSSSSRRGRDPTALPPAIQPLTQQRWTERLHTSRRRSEFSRPPAARSAVVDLTADEPTTSASRIRTSRHVRYALESESSESGAAGMESDRRIAPVDSEMDDSSANNSDSASARDSDSEEPSTPASLSPKPQIRIRRYVLFPSGEERDTMTETVFNSRWAIPTARAAHSTPPRRPPPHRQAFTRISTENRVAEVSSAPADAVLEHLERSTSHLLQWLSSLLNRTGVSARLLRAATGWLMYALVAVVLGSSGLSFPQKAALLVMYVEWMF
ncbi:hypothetical protein MMC34_002203 [Xylographa carneopallida]|nr:hypothetical protein [Xylographa carneopallida]